MSGKLRWLVNLSLASFIITVTSIAVASFIVYKRGIQANEMSNSLRPSTPDASASGQAGNSQQTITLNTSEVALHAVPSNCWMIINSSVYDVTTFLASHPGGSIVMTPYCGKDASLAFQTKDRKPAITHTSTAKNMLKQYFIGDLGQMLVIPGGNVANILPTGLPGQLKPTVPVATIAIQPSGSVIASNTTLTTSVVATHNTSSNCWITISGTVYNVSSFLTSHPGGVNVITIYCGKDATTAFATKDQNPPSGHSAYAVSLLAAYKVGVLGSPIVSNTSSATGNVSLVNTPIPTVAPPAPTATAPPVSTGGYTTADVSGHNTTANCWIIISGKVYNVTSYLVSHPGGINAIAPYCGQEATNAFSTKGGRGSNHSNYAYTLLNQYFIGNLNTGSVSNPAATPVPGSASSTPIPTTSGSICTEGILPPSITNKYSGATIKQQEVGDNCSQELEVNTSIGCRHIKTNSSGAITSDSSC